MNIDKIRMTLLHKREQKGLSAETLGKMIGVNKTTIYRYEKGQIKKMPLTVVNKLSTALGINPEFIAGFSDEPDIDACTTLTQINETASHLEPPRQEKVLTYTKDQLHQQQKVTSLADKRKEKHAQQENLLETPFKGAASAGTGEFLQDEINETILLPSKMIPDGTDYCLLVNGNSMEPVILDDSYIFVQYTHEVASGTIAVVMYNGESYIKRVWFENDTARLESFNKDYEDIIVKDTDTFRVTGKVLL